MPKIIPCFSAFFIFGISIVSQAGNAILVRKAEEVSRPISGIVGNEDRTAVAASNELKLKQYSGEWRYNLTAAKDRPPQIGLALSGGGTRSGSFSVGVMNGLARNNILQKLDIISSVSGGGYASSWYYLQRLNSSVQPESLFDESGAYQKYLQDHGELMAHASAGATHFRRSQYIFIDGPITVLSMPVNLIANGIFGWHANVVPVRWIYEKGIDREFHVIPDERLERSFEYRVTGASFFGATHVDWPTLAERIEGRLPFPIVNATAYTEQTRKYGGTELRNRVYEFTPQHCGSDVFGYASNSPVNFNRAIAISGAAFDTAKISNGAAEKLAFSALNLDLGYSIDNPSIASGPRMLRRALPIPFYLFTGHYQYDQDGDRIYLSDGGHSENLGAYSLVRRLCRNIIIVDAEQDPKYEFEAYHILKQALRNEMAVNFSVPEIDQEKGAQYYGQRPVMIGKISSFPLLDPAPRTVVDTELRVIYIKASIDEARLLRGGYDADIAVYYNSSHRGFPQESTLDQSFTADQVKAYHKLGLTIVQENKDLITGTLAGH